MGALKNTEIPAGHAIPAERHSGQKQREALNGGIPTKPADTKGADTKGLGVKGLGFRGFGFSAGTLESYYLTIPKPQS